MLLLEKLLEKSYLRINIQTLLYNSNIIMTIETRFLEINQTYIKKRIRELNGRPVKGKKQFLQSSFYLKNEFDETIRIIEDNKKTYLRMKKYYKNNELEIYDLEVNANFEKTNVFFEQMDLKHKKIHESLQETWSIPNKNINSLKIITLPGINPFLEIEAKNEKAIDFLVDKLKLVENDNHIGPIYSLYTHYYGISNDSIKKIPLLTFNNKDLFQKIVERQKTINVKY
jgi:hypothetical protein